MTTETVSAEPLDRRISHPPGLATLFFTEMWERFSFYGMRGLLVLYLATVVEKGGMGLSDKVATAIYGLYTAGVYLAALPGGWIADRLLGPRKAVWAGGILITIGHFLLAVPVQDIFFLGLMFLVLGTGLLKPNISTLVGQLYPAGGAQRDAGFTIFYMGINLGATLGPLLCGYLGEKVNWHYGFAAAGFGMILGLIQFGLTERYLGHIGLEPHRKSDATKHDWKIVGGCIAILTLVVCLALMRVLSIDPIWLANRTTVLISLLALLYFAWALAFAGLDSNEQKRVVVIGILFLASALFWAGYEQAGSSLNLFAERFTDRNIESLGIHLTTASFQSFSAALVIVLAPLMAWVWIKLTKNGISLSLAAKFAIALFLLAAGFVVMAIASRRALNHGTVWPSWLMTTYLLHVLGELCLSPVGLSSVTKLAPKKLVGQMMGIWFLATSLGNLLGGLFAGEVSGENTKDMPDRFWWLMSVVGVCGLVLLLSSGLIRRLGSEYEPKDEQA